MAEKLSEKQQITLWFVRLRWGALLLMLLVILTSIYPGRLLVPIVPLLGIIAVAALYNLIFPFMVRRYRWFSENVIFTYLRSSADILVVTIMIHFSGGIESPFTLLYVLELTAISVFGFEQIAYFLAFQSAFLYVSTTYLEAFSFIKHYRLIESPGTNYGAAKGLALFFTLILTVYIASYLAGKLREKQKEIEALSNAQADFVSMVMHETKSPLTSIIGYSDILISGGLGAVSDKLQEPLNIIKRQSNRILLMVNDLLSLARLESGRTKFEQKPASLAELANHVIEEAGPSLNAKNLKMILEADPKTPAARIDEDKILEVLTNLISNAIKFSGDGGRIFLTITPQGKEIMVSVRDEGIGIKENDLPHIFEKFYRASKEAADRKGTGLGLALSKLIVEAHGGKLWAVSAGPGQGAVFYFTVPTNG
jgi:signal transduction histidine kinase